MSAPEQVPDGTFGQARPPERVRLDEVRAAVARADEVLAAIDAVPVADTRAARWALLEQRTAILDGALAAVRQAVR